MVEGVDLSLATIKCRNVTFPNIQAVLFDKDGTLANSENFLRNLGHKRSRLIDAQIPGVGDPLLMAFGFQDDRLNPAGLMAVGSRRDNQIAAAAYVAETGRDWVESLEIVASAFDEADRYMQNKAVQTPLFEGAARLLKSLRSVGLKLGVLSSDITENVRDFVRTYQLESYVTLEMGVFAGLSKPDPELFRQACQQLGVKPANALMVGDSQADVDMARSAGAAGCVAVSWGWTKAILPENADVAIARFDEMQAIG